MKTNKDGWPDWTTVDQEELERATGFFFVTHGFVRIHSNPLNKVSQIEIGKGVPLLASIIYPLKVRWERDTKEGQTVLP